jgi:hypothetical protein
MKYTGMGEIEILGLSAPLNLAKLIYFFSLCSNLKPVQWDFLHSGQKQMRLLERNDSKQSLKTFSCWSIFSFNCLCLLISPMPASQAPLLQGTIWILWLVDGNSTIITWARSVLGRNAPVHFLVCLTLVTISRIYNNAFSLKLSDGFDKPKWHNTLRWKDSQRTKTILLGPVCKLRRKWSFVNMVQGNKCVRSTRDTT